jgi:hypothetical protein
VENGENRFLSYEPNGREGKGKHPHQEIYFVGFFLFLYFIAAAGSFAYWPLNKPVGTGGGGVGEVGGWQRIYSFRKKGVGWLIC